MWDDVYAWALTQAEALDGIEQVYDGPPRQDPSERKYAIVGGEDAGNYAQDTDPTDTFTAEAGEVVITLVSRSGDDDLTPHRAATKAWVDSLAATVNADRTLGGVLRQGSTAYVRADIRQVTSGGVYVERNVVISYGTRV